MAAPSAEFNPQPYARLGGALYLVIIILGIFGEMFVRDRIFVAGDPAATAAHLRAMEGLWRLGIVTEFIALVCAVILAMIYFVLLRPVNRELNLLATFLRLMSAGVQSVAVLNLVTALYPVGNAAYLQAFTPEQLHAMTTLAIRAHSHGFSIALLYTGCTFLVHGYLIFRSGYIPRILGILIQIAGVAYIVNTIVLILYPALAGQMFLALLAPVLIAEVSLSVWLLVKGVNLPRWREAVAAMSSRPALA